MPNRGYKQTKEHREKLRPHLIGNKFALGHIPRNKGKKIGPLSKKHKEKIGKSNSISMIGNKNSLGQEISDKTKERESIAQRKRYEDPKEREKISGPNNHFYIDNRSSLNRKPKDCYEHRRWARQIRERDNYTCQICKEEGWVAHHINYNPNDFDLNNGICLCPSCHSKTNTNRKYWEELLSYSNLINSIVRIAKSQEIDLVVAISRGGIIPGLMISENIGIPLDVIVASSYTKKNKRSKLRLGDPSYLCFSDISKESKIFIVDDLVDTGKTMKAVVDLYKKKGFKNIKTAVLYFKEGSKFNPDFFIKREKKNIWIKFPYEKKLKERS